MNKRETLIVGLTKLDAELELNKVEHFYKEIRGHTTKFYQRDLTVETDGRIIKGTGVRGLTNFDGYRCNEFVLTPHLLNSKSIEELVEIIRLCKTMTFKYRN